MYFRLFRANLKQNIFIKRFFRCNTLRLSKETSESTDEPIKYTTSKAAKWKAIYSSSGEDYYTTPRIQSLAIVASLTVFMVYFCMLREENDLDDWLRELETNIPIQVQEAQLRIDIANGKKKGIDVSAQEKKLEEIIAARTMKTQ